MKLYCFNPEHDLAIANGGENFQAPESAMLLSADLSLLPAWYADENSLVLSEQQFEPYNIPPGLNIQSVAPYSGKIPAQCSVEPWGWDAAIRKKIIAVGVHPSSVPNAGQLDTYRNLSHRRIASQAMDYIRQNAAVINPDKLPAAAIELKTLADIKTFASAHHEIVLKSPWSGSGRGVFWSKGTLTQSLNGWCQRTLEKQGCVMGELAMQRIQDFAMEYRIRNGKSEFAGYSLFITEGSGIYRGNRLMSNETIVAKLNDWIPSEQLLSVQQTIQNFIDSHIAPHYDGFVGVDMFVYRDGTDICINPAVEINLRMTMGMVARVIFDKYISPQSTGWFYIDHEPPGQLLSDHTTQSLDHPIQYTDGKLSKGYLSLCPIHANTVYRASILLD